MAGKNNASIDINLVTNIKDQTLNAAKQAVERHQKEGAFEGAQGARNLTRIQNAIAQIANINPASVTNLDAFFKDIKKLLDLIDKNALTLKNVSAEYKKAADDLTKAQQRLDDAKAQKSQALKAKQQAQQNIVKDENVKFSKNGKAISAPQTVMEAFRGGTLTARNAEGKSITGAALEQTLRKRGYLNYEAADQELQKATKNADDAAAAVDKFADALAKVPAATGANPAVKQTLDETSAVRGLVDKEQNKNIENLEKDVKNTDDSFKAFDATLKKQETSLGKAFKAFTIYNLVLKTVKRSLHEAVQTVKQLDRSLTEQAMVTGKTRAQTYSLLSSYQALAKATGATTKDVAEVATQFMRQGKTAQDSIKLTEAAVSAAKVAGISATESVNYLTTALNGFRLSADQAMKVSDKFASIAAISATSYEELATALSKVAAQANLAGMSIDYTTALLAKGIETTREAPETIGTALKTIIARMRELGDYGKTLDDSMDINNVETQLAYVGIALRDANGELRSTEDVLNDLGAKWETLNNNQQAAVAKALAGTRQQSRLIAMMTDYERVMELQEIAAQSAGATSAQMATYMEGLDAALNKIRVSWEGLVSNLTNSEVVIGFTNMLGGILGAFEKVAETLPGQIAIWAGIATLGISILANKMRELQLQKQQNKLILEQRKQTIEQSIRTKKNAVQTLIHLKQQEKQESKITQEKWQQVYAEAMETDNVAEAQYAWEQINKESLQQSEIDGEIVRLNSEIAGLEGERARLSLDILSNSQGLTGTIGSLLQPLSGIIGLMTTIIAKQKLMRVEGDKNNVVKSKGMFAGVVEAFSSAGIPGVIAGIALATSLIAMLGIGITAVSGAIGSSFKSTSQKLDESSAKMYNMRKEISAIQTAVDAYDELDKKIIKTNEDIENMSKTLSEVADKISDADVGKNEDIGFGKGVSAKEYYESLADSETAQYQFLLEYQQKLTKELEDERKQQLKIIKGNLGSLEGNSTDAIKNRATVLANANSAAYNAINALKKSDELASTEVTALRKTAENIISKMTSKEQLALADNMDEMNHFINSLGRLEVQLNSGNIKAAYLLNSADSTLSEQMKAYSTILNSLEGSQRQAFETYYTQFNGLFELAEANQKVIDYIDNSTFTIDKLNDFYAKQEKLKKVGLDYNDEQWHSMFVNEIMPSLAETNGDIAAVIDSVFSAQLAELEDDLEAYNALVDAFGDLIEVGVLNMGQNLESLYNSINNIYSKASEWSSMSETDRTQFILDHSDLFSGESGAELLAAFETGNYNLIEKALQSNENLQKTVSRRIDEIEQELLIEEARRGDARNEAYIKYLKDQKKQLEDQTNLFRADLKLLVDQQQAQLDIYKEYLQKQNEQLEDALNARKEAYQKYFDALAEMQEDADYEEEATRLATNAAKLASSTDAHSNAVRADLEAQLEELEKEHLKELRERAQEAVLNNIDDEVEHMSEQLDKILENSELLYQLMQQQMAAGGNAFLGQLIEGKAATGELTSLEMENWIMSTLGPAFASVLNGINYNDLIGLGTSATNYNTSLNINQAVQSLTDDQQAVLGTTILNVLRSMGYMN